MAHIPQITAHDRLPKWLLGIVLLLCFVTGSSASPEPVHPTSPHPTEQAHQARKLTDRRPLYRWATHRAPQSWPFAPSHQSHIHRHTHQLTHTALHRAHIIRTNIAIPPFLHPPVTLKGSLHAHIL